MFKLILNTWDDKISDLIAVPPGLPHNAAAQQRSNKRSAMVTGLPYLLTAVSGDLLRHETAGNIFRTTILRYEKVLM